MYQTFSEFCQAFKKGSQSVITVIEMNPHGDGKAEDDIKLVTIKLIQMFF